MSGGCDGTPQLIRKDPGEDAPGSLLAGKHLDSGAGGGHGGISRERVAVSAISRNLIRAERTRASEQDGAAATNHMPDKAGKRYNAHMGQGHDVEKGFQDRLPSVGRGTRDQRCNCRELLAERLKMVAITTKRQKAMLKKGLHPFIHGRAV